MPKLKKYKSRETKDYWFSSRDCPDKTHADAVWDGDNGKKYRLILFCIIPTGSKFKQNGSYYHSVNGEDVEVHDHEFW